MSLALLGRELHVVLPWDIDDPRRPSGGNRYDRMICQELRAQGRQVVEHIARGEAAVRQLLQELPDRVPVLLDGLVASAAPGALAEHAGRLRLVALVHMPLGDTDPADLPTERSALSTVDAVVATSHWCRNRLIELYALDPAKVHAAPPGVELAPLATPSAGGNRLLCVAALTPNKGHDLLVTALDRLPDLDWSCRCAGALDLDPAYAEDLLARAPRRMTFAGPLTGQALEDAYAAADLLVLPSRGETYGMVVTEALAHGVPVLTTDTKGLPEALGETARGELPGLLVPPGDAAALAAALRRWLTEPQLRTQIRASTVERRATLTGWAQTARDLAAVIQPRN